MLRPPLAASELLPVFDRHAARFIVVGAVAAVAAGALILTKYVDLLIDSRGAPRDPEASNIEGRE
jgi:hypothetical protein